jgi:uncharacterized protein (DUF2384 family)
MDSLECSALFSLYTKLLAVYEPFDATMWFVSPQATLGNRRPCELLATTEGRDLVRAVIAQLLDGAHV